jgi:hypothetical protein
VRHDHGPAPPVALGSPAGHRWRLLTGRPIRVPEAALARRRTMALRHEQAAAPPLPIGPAGPTRRAGPARGAAAGLPGTARARLGRGRGRRKGDEEREGRREGDPGARHHAD